MHTDFAHRCFVVFFGKPAMNLFFEPGTPNRVEAPGSSSVVIFSSYRARGSKLLRPLLDKPAGHVFDATMLIDDLGYNDQLEQYRIKHDIDLSSVGRVITEHKDHYIVKTNQGEFEAEITGNMRYSAQSRKDLPAVGDWVAIQPYDINSAIINMIFPRASLISRKSLKDFSEIQIIAANIDFALIVQAAGHDFNLNRLERYLTICHSSRVEPVIVLTKIDLIGEQDLLNIKESIKARIPDVPLLAISNETGQGYDELKSVIQKRKTWCMLGSSGVGKSTLINHLCGASVMETGAISQSTSKGRHVTSHRELVMTQSGAILIDNPGMREVGLADNANGVDATFDKIAHLAQNCKYKDCTHTKEAGCAVLEALSQKKIEQSYYDHYMKIEKEISHFETTAQEKQKKEKGFQKIRKEYKKMNIKRREP